MLDRSGPRILIAGYYGFDNAGDEAVLSAMLADLRALAPGLSATVAVGRLPAASADGIESVLYTDLPGIVAAAQAADLVIVGGGGLFHDYWPFDPEDILTPRHYGISYYAGIPLLAAALGKPCAMYAVGVGPLLTDAGRSSTRAAFEQARLLTVRDAPSKAVLVSLGIDPGRIHVTADPVFGMPSAGPDRAEEILSRAGLETRQRPRVGVALRPWNIGVDPAQWQRQVGLALDEFLQRSGGVAVFVPFQGLREEVVNDVAVAHGVRAGMRHGMRTVVLDVAHSPAEKAAVLGACDVVLGMRLHSLVFAMSAGVAAVALSYDPKVKAVMAEAGAAEQVLEIGAVTAEALSAALSDTYARRTEIGERLRAAAGQRRGRARENARLALALLDDGRAETGVDSLRLARSVLVQQTLKLARAQAVAAESWATVDALNTELRARDSRAEAQARDLAAAAAHAEAQERDRARDLAATAAHAQAVTRQLGIVSAEKSAIEASRGLALLRKIRRVRLAIAPSGSRRERWMLLGAPRADAVVPPAPSVAEPKARENACDVVVFTDGNGDAGRATDAIAALAEAGHRVFLVAAAFRAEGPAYERRPVAANVFHVSLRGPDFDVHRGALDAFGRDQLFAALDELRRGEALGATLCLVQLPFWEPLARKAREALAWAVADVAPAAGALAEAFPRVSIVVAATNGESTRRCLESISAHTEWPNVEMVVMDDRSGARGGAGVELAAANQGLASAGGEFLVLVGGATVVERGWLAALVRHLTADPTIGAIGPAPSGWGYAHAGPTLNIAAVATSCLAMRKSVFAAVGPFDERFTDRRLAAADFSRRVRRLGLRTVAAHDAFVRVSPEASVAAEAGPLPGAERDGHLYEEKWGEPWPGEGAPGERRAAEEVMDRQLETLAARVRAARGAVIFLPSIGWNVHLVQRPHHLARAFVAAGYVSVFDCSNHWNDMFEGFKEIEPSLFLYRGPAEALGRVRDAVLWTFPYNFHLREHHPPETPVVYDWIDDLSVFLEEPSLLERNHRAALEEATVVASVARTLDEEARRVRPDALYLPNAVEFDRFAREDAPPPLDRALSGLLSAGRPIAGYYGALARWFDYALLDELSRLRPDWSFLLIGPDYDHSLAGQPALARPNVAWLGPRPYERLPSYLQLFDVAMIPFQINAITLSTSPLKLFEYFAGGKPVVTTPMPECMAFPEVRIAAAAREFALALDQAREDGRDPVFRERLRAVARANSWDARVQQTAAALERERPRGAPAYTDVLR